MRWMPWVCRRLVTVSYAAKSALFRAGSQPVVSYDTLLAVLRAFCVCIMVGSFLGTGAPMPMRFAMGEL